MDLSTTVRNCLNKNSLVIMDMNNLIKEGLTALHCASIHGRTKEASILLDHGDNIEAATKRGMTPLHFAVQGNHSECMKMLLDRKAPINYLNEVQIIQC